MTTFHQTRYSNDALWDRDEHIKVFGSKDQRSRSSSNSLSQKQNFAFAGMGLPYSMHAIELKSIYFLNVVQSVTEP